MQSVPTRTRETADPACSPNIRVTRSLLGYGVIAGPIYVVSVLAQGLTRRGFDLLRDDASLLSNGSLGWIQILTFVACGAIVVAFAVGVARALATGRASTWGPRLIGLYGLGLIGAGLFVADPMNGFPPGTAAGRPEVVSVHGMLHIVAAGVGFLGLVAACLVIAARFARIGRRRWALYSRVTGILFLAGFLGIASGSGSPAVVLGFWVAILLAWSWLAALGMFLYREVSEGHEI
jgi:Protein of unknown function (DUF998)